MSTRIDSLPTAVRHPSLRSYWLEVKYECLRTLRTPSFALPSLLFPALFYLMFGVLLNRGNPDAARYLLATYGVFGVMGTGVFAFGVTVAIERERGFITYKRALPMPPGAYLLAKMAVAMLFATLISVLIGVLGATLAHVWLAPAQWLALLAVNVLGVLPFCAMGLLIGTLVGGQGAPAVVNLIYLPMSLLSGLWLPLTMLPAIFATIAPAWPPYHLARIALRVVGMAPAGDWLLVHVAVLLALAGACAWIAARRLARAQVR